MTLFDLMIFAILGWFIALAFTAFGAIGNALMLRHPVDPPEPEPWSIREQLKRDAWHIVVGQLGMLLLGGAIGLAVATMTEPANLQLGVWLLMLTLAAAEGLLLLVFKRARRPNAVTYWTLRRDIADVLNARSTRHPSDEPWTRLFRQAEGRHFVPPIGRRDRGLGEHIDEVLGELNGRRPSEFDPIVRQRLDRWVGLQWMFTLHPWTLSSWLAPVLSVVAAGIAGVVLVANPTGDSWVWILIMTMPALSLLLARCASRLRVLSFVRRAWLERTDREWCRDRIHRLRGGRRPFPPWTASTMMRTRPTGAT